MTYCELCECLTEAGIENAGLEAALLIGHFFGISRASILGDPEHDYDSPKLYEAIDRRCEHYPLQYLFGEWDFFSETYHIDENCLIPRADTELLVEYAIEHLPKKARFADLCTGSGCIAISTLVHRPDCTALAADLYEGTLALARKNAERNGVASRLDLLLADVLDGNALDGHGNWDAILCNPPYIRTAVLDTLEKELDFEPRAALDGGPDGLNFYRILLEHHGKLLCENGFLLLEIGYDQKEDILMLAKESGYTSEVKNDLSGNPRMAILHRIAKKENRS